MTEFITSFPDELVCVNFTVVDDELFEGLEVVGITIKSANTSIGNFSETFLLYIGDNDESESHNYPRRVGGHGYSSLLVTRGARERPRV